MGTAFADFCAEQDARNTIHLNVLKYSYMLCDALTQNFIDYSISGHQKFVGTDADTHEYHQRKIDELKAGKCDYSYIIESGSKYHKVIMVIDNGPDRSPSRSVHAFIDKKTGSLYKAASWRGPTKGERYNLLLIKDREWILENADWSGSWLYKH